MDDIRETAATTSTATIEWDAVNSADGYEVWNASKTKLLQRSSKNTYKATGLSGGNIKTLNIRSYGIRNGKYYYSTSFETVVAKPAPKKVGGLSLSRSGKKVTLSWSVASGSGYEVYRSASGKKYNKIKTIKSSGTHKYIDRYTKKKKTYYYKVRAYRTVSGGKVYGSFSDAKKVTAN